MPKTISTPTADFMMRLRSSIRCEMNESLTSAKSWSSVMGLRLHGRGRHQWKKAWDLRAAVAGRYLATRPAADSTRVLWLFCRLYQEGMADERSSFFLR